MNEKRRSVGTTARINQLLDGLRDGDFFSSQDLLECGSRGAVDQAVYMAVKAGRIQRLRRGMFCKSYNGQVYNFDRIDMFMFKSGMIIRKKGLR